MIWIVSPGAEFLITFVQAGALDDAEFDRQ
jgi:hypothetical protein